MGEMSFRTRKIFWKIYIRFRINRNFVKKRKEYLVRQERLNNFAFLKRNIKWKGVIILLNHV